MQHGFIPALQAEERQLVGELRATAAFRKLDAIRRLIALYGGMAGAPPEGVVPANTAEPSLVKEVEDPGPQAMREGNKAVSVVRAALAAVTG